MGMEVNTLTETVNQQGGHITVMQERITNLETIVQKQNQDLISLEHEKNVLNDTVMGQKTEIDRMGNDLRKIHEAEGGNIIKELKAQNGRTNFGNTFVRSTTTSN